MRAIIIQQSEIDVLREQIKVCKMLHWDSVPKEERDLDKIFEDVDAVIERITDRDGK